MNKEGFVVGYGNIRPRKEFELKHIVIP